MPPRDDAVAAPPLAPNYLEWRASVYPDELSTRTEVALLVTQYALTFGDDEEDPPIDLFLSEREIAIAESLSALEVFSAAGALLEAFRERTAGTLSREASDYAESLHRWVVVERGRMAKREAVREFRTRRPTPRPRARSPRRNVRTTPAALRGPPPDDPEPLSPDGFRGFLTASLAMFAHERRRLGARAAA